MGSQKSLTSSLGAATEGPEEVLSAPWVGRQRDCAGQSGQMLGVLPG